MNVKERCQLADNGTNLGKPPPLIPAMLNTFNNKPFTLLLPAFILDNLGTSIITSLVVFFVRYIVQPEFSNLDLGCKPWEVVSWMCNSILWSQLLFLLGGAFLFCPCGWLLQPNLKKSWLLWSFTNGHILMPLQLVKETFFVCDHVFSMVRHLVGNFNSDGRCD